MEEKLEKKRIFCVSAMRSSVRLSEGGLTALKLSPIPSSDLVCEIQMGLRFPGPIANRQAGAACGIVCGG